MSKNGTLIFYNNKCIIIDSPLGDAIYKLGHFKCPGISVDQD